MIMRTLVKILIFTLGAYAVALSNFAHSLSTYHSWYFSSYYNDYDTHRYCHHSYKTGCYDSIKYHACSKSYFCDFYDVSCPHPIFKSDKIFKKIFFKKDEKERCDIEIQGIFEGEVKNFKREIFVSVLNKGKASNIKVRLFADNGIDNLLVGIKSAEIKKDNSFDFEFLVDSDVNVVKAEAETCKGVKDFETLIIGERDEFPVALFEYSPSKPMENEIVVFNASASFDTDGEIKSYAWNFGDGTAGFGKIAEHSYEKGGTYTVKLEVVDNDGLISIKSEKIKVASKTGNLIVKVINGDNKPVENAKVTVSGEDRDFKITKTTDSNGIAPFDNLEIGSYGISAEKGIFKNFGNAEVFENETTTAVIKFEDFATLRVIVKNEVGIPIKNAEIAIERTDEVLADGLFKGISDKNGFALFKGLEDGEYRIFVSAKGFLLRDKEIDLDEGEVKTVEIFLQKILGDSDLKIIQVIMPKIIPGKRAIVEVLVKNFNDKDKVKVVLEAFNLAKSTEEREIKKGETSNFIIEMDVPEDAEKLSFMTIKAIGKRSFDEVVQEISIGEIFGSMEVFPIVAKFNEPLRIEGFVTAEGAKIFANDQVINVETDETGFFSQFLKPKKSGEVKIELKFANKLLDSEDISVVPKIQIRNLKIPEIAFAGDKEKICFEVLNSDPGDVSVKLIINGQVFERSEFVKDKKEVCFNTVIESAGKIKAEAIAERFGARDSKSLKIEAMDKKEEVSVFPSNFDVPLGKLALIKVGLFNLNNRSREYEVSIEGINKEWVHISENRALLKKGEEREIFISINPNREGNFKGKVEVKRNGEEIFEKEVLIKAFGPAKKWVLSLLLAYLPYILGAILVVILIIFILRRRALEPESFY